MTRVDEWKEVARHYDTTSGSVHVHHRNGKGNAYRFRIPSYDRKLLQRFREILGRGIITTEEKPKGPYYRLEISSLEGTLSVLGKIVPFLDNKRELVIDWIKQYQSPTELRTRLSGN